MKRFFLHHGLTMLFLFSLIFSVFVYSVYPVEAEDLFSNIVSGKYVWETRSVPRSDPFSYTGPFNWFFDRALSSVVFFLLHKAGGFPAIILTTFATIAASFVLLYLFFLRRGIPSVIPFILISLTIPASSYWFLTRSYTFGYVFLALYFMILLWERPRLYLLLLPLQILWTNLHSSSVLGILLVWLHWFTMQKKSVKTAILPMVVVAVGVVSPVGWEFFPNLWKELTNPPISRGNIFEWFSPFHPAIRTQPLTLWFIVALLVFGVCVVLLALRAVRFRQSLFLVLVNLALVRLAFASHRHVPIFYYGLLVLVIFVAGELWKGAKSLLSERQIRRVLVGLGVTSILVVNGVSLWVGTFGYSNGANMRKFGLGINTTKFPDKLLTELKSYNLNGTIFTEYGYGSFFLYKMYPQYKVYIDGGRLDQVYGDEFYKHYLNMGTDKATITADIEKYTVQALLLPFPASQSDVVEIYKYASTDPAWKLAYFDDQHMLFIDKEVAKEKNIPTFTLLNPLLDIEGAVKEKKELRDPLESDFRLAETLVPQSFNLLTLRARFLSAIDQQIAAVMMLDRMAEFCQNNDANSSCYLRLVRQMLKYGQITKALPYRRRMISGFEPSSGEFTLLGDLDSAAGRFDEAISAYTKAKAKAISNDERKALDELIEQTKEKKKKFQSAQSRYSMGVGVG